MRTGSIRSPGCQNKRNMTLCNSPGAAVIGQNGPPLPAMGASAVCM
jgi:hypothetical protein